METFKNNTTSLKSGLKFFSRDTEDLFQSLGPGNTTDKKFERLTWFGVGKNGRICFDELILKGLGRVY